MARSFSVVALIVSAFCFSSVLAGPTDSMMLTKRGGIYDPNMKISTTQTKVNFFAVYGYIYCDPCGLQVLTRLSKPLGGVKVAFECTKGEKNVTLVKETTTLENGVYNFKIEGAHEEEVCKVKAVNEKSPCTYNIDNKSGTIVPTKNVGLTISSFQRSVKPIEFSPEPNKIGSDQCEKLATELGVDMFNVKDD